LFLQEGFKLLLLVGYLILLVRATVELVVDSVDAELNLLHSEHALNRWLGVQRQAHVDALHVIELLLL
jgi:hypothetical protein